MGNSKVAVAVSKLISLVQMISGICVVLFFGLGVIALLSQGDIVSAIVCLIFVALGVWLIKVSRKTSKLINEFKKYVAAISHKPDGYIPDIAASIGTSEDVVRTNLELMLKKKYFSNAYIDKSSNCIIISGRQSGQNMANSANASMPTGNVPNMISTVEMVTVKCPGCGGINTIAKGQTGECDYCGSGIKGE